MRTKKTSTKNEVILEAADVRCLKRAAEILDWLGMNLAGSIHNIIATNSHDAAGTVLAILQGREDGVFDLVAPEKKTPLLDSASQSEHDNMAASVSGKKS